MVWGWVHNFPASVDVFTKPIDYPDVGYDTIIANWLQDIFDGVEAIQEALGYDITGGYADLDTRLSGGLYRPRIGVDPADFDEGDFSIGDDYELDLSGIIPVGTSAVVISGALWTADAPGQMIFRPVDGIWDDIEIISAAAGDDFLLPFHAIVPVNSSREIAYYFETALIAGTWLSVTGYFN